MCIILFAWKQHPDYPLVVAANRDEFHHRPAEAARWRGDIICGLDLAAGGTWLGATNTGRFAAVTNFREPIADNTPGNRSRGMLPLGFLEKTSTPEQYLTELTAVQEEYGPYKLICSDGESLWYTSNRSAAPQALEPGIYALSNGLLGSEWPKTRLGKSLLENALKEGISTDVLLDILKDDSLPDDDELPDTGVGIDMERLVAPIFVRSPVYGTRASTAVMQAGEKIEFEEVRFNESR